MSLISVIVPVYNVEPYIKRCIDSILSQSFSDFDLILVDDGSPDNCPQICDEYAEKYNRVVVIHKENGGLSDARNQGIEWAINNSDSEYITFIDSDDWVHNQYLELLISPFSDNDIDISVGRILRVYENSRIEQFSNTSINTLSPAEYWTQFGYNSANCKLYRKYLFNYIIFPVNKICEDAFTIYKIIFSVSKIAYSNAPIYYYYSCNNDSIMTSKWSLRRLDEYKAHAEQYHYFKSIQSDACLVTTFHKYLFFLITSILNIKQYYPEEKQLQKEIKGELKSLIFEKKQYLWLKQSDYLYYNAVVKSLHDMLTDITYIRKTFDSGTLYVSIINFYLVSIFHFHRKSIKSIQGYNSVYRELHPGIFRINKVLKKLINNLKEHSK